MATARSGSRTIRTHRAHLPDRADHRTGEVRGWPASGRWAPRRWRVGFAAMGGVRRSSWPPPPSRRGDARQRLVRRGGPLDGQARETGTCAMCRPDGTPPAPLRQPPVARVGRWPAGACRRSRVDESHRASWGIRIAEQGRRWPPGNRPGFRPGFAREREPRGRLSGVTCGPDTRASSPDLFASNPGPVVTPLSGLRPPPTPPARTGRARTGG